MKYTVIQEITSQEQIRIHKPSESYDYFKEYIKLGKSLFYIMILDKTNYLSSIQIIDIENYKSQNKEAIFRPAKKLKSRRIIIAHNKSTKTLKPSKEDFEITKNLIKVGDLNQVKVLDHLIIGKEGYYSLAENNKVKFTN